MADRVKIILKVFEIPSWYGKVMSQEEKTKLWNCIKEATCVEDARLNRVLDCSAYCVEEKCFFCGSFAGKEPKH